MNTTSSSTPGPARSALGLAGFLLLCFAVAALGAHSAEYYIPHWYDTLVKPPFTPPDEMFIPGWVILYAIMAIAAWLVWRSPRRRSRSRSAIYTDTRGSNRLDALIVFFIQLALSLIWMEAFFHTHRLLVSAVVILFLWIAVSFTIALFWRVRPLAAVLLLPYLACVTFTIALNLVLLRLN